MPTTYTESENGGITVNRSAGGADNDVEILDETGRVRASYEDLTDLRIAKTTASTGDTITVFPGQYTTRNLLKDGVDWHFEDGAVVTNPGDETGGIFENVGAHGSPGGPVESHITGRGVFELQDPAASSGFSVMNLGNKDSDIYFEAKEIRDDGGQFPTTGPTYFFHSAGTLEAHIERFQQTTDDGSLVQTRFLDTTDSGSTPEATETANVDITVDEFDYTESSVYLGIQGTDAADDWRGVSNLHIKTLRSGNDEFGAFFTQTSATEGYSRIQVDNHAEGQFDQCFGYTDGSKSMFLDGFDVNYGGGGYAVNVGSSATPSLYLRDLNVRNPSFDASAGTPDAITADAAQTIQSVGGNRVGGGSAAVGSNVTIEGSDIQDTV